MVACKREGCDKEVGKNGRKGFCQKCYRSNSIDSHAGLSCSSVANLFSPPPASLNQSLDVTDIVMVNSSFKTKSTDYVTISDSPPHSVDELFVMIVQFKDDAIASLSFALLSYRRS